jgi:parvulin-like peptidyl-prolyl isomerase
VEGLQPGGTSKLVEQARGFYLLRLEDRLSKEKLEEVTRLWLARPLAARAAADAATQEFAKALIASLSAAEPGKGMQESLNALVVNALTLSPVYSAAKQAGAARQGELLAAARDSRDRPQVDVSPSFTRSGVAAPVYNAVQGAATKQLAFALPAVGDVYAEPIATRDGLAVLQLKDREPAKREDFEKEKTEFMRELKQKAEVEALSAHVSRLRQAREKEITINPRFLDDKSPADDS